MGYLKENYDDVLFDAIPDIIFVMDVNGEYLDFKGGKGQVFISGEGIIGSNIKSSKLNVALIDSILEHLNKAIETNEVDEMYYEISFPNDKIRYYESRASKIDDTSAIRIVREITDVIEANKVIDYNIIQLTNYNFDLSHKIRNHLTNIMLINDLADITLDKNNILKLIHLMKDSTLSLDGNIKELYNEIAKNLILNKTFKKQNYSIE